MTNAPTRRDFLGLSAIGLAAVIAPEDLAASSTKAHGNAGTAPASGSEISVWVTSGEDRFATAPRANWSLASSTNEATTGQILLNPATKYQDILGFGGAFTDATCYMFNQLAAPAREQL
ncbi:MAG: twin-arginine translocation signal domain-containing protein, partial [Candidatus Acidiferrales bacterium]